MSELTTAARPYAKAVFEKAQEADALENWSKQLQAMSEVVAAEGSSDLFAYPSMGRNQKVDLFKEVVGDGINDQGINLLKTLAENNRFELLPEISRLFEQQKADAEGSIEVELVSAYEVTDEQCQNLSTALQKRFGREIKLITTVDDSLMGGAIIRAGDLVIDGSIHSRLKEMKTALSR